MFRVYRAVRTLVVYLHETNVHLAGWLVQYMNKNPINLASPDSEVGQPQLTSQQLASMHLGPLLTLRSDA